ncbi:MAG: carboxymuconolactone decarboxylase family protein [Bacteroidetes bacterium]|nr:carboxymuconolactone decarboxylase family protein [Bacteroidota bacterium]
MKDLMFIQTISEAEAEGKLRDIYQGDNKNMGYVPNHAKVFSLRPEVLETWRAFQGSIRKNLRLRRYELVTFAAAMALNCRYCLLAHGTILINNGISLAQLRLILKNFNEAGLEEDEITMMAFAQKIIRNANEIKQSDIDVLRAHKLDDAEILDITLTATMRSFASKTFDALGAEPDAVYKELELQLADLLPA